MQPVTLYGKGAVRLHDDKQSYSAADGKITVPPALVAQLVAMGFSHFPPEAETPAVEEAPVPTEPAVAAVPAVVSSADDSVVLVASGQIATAITDYADARLAGMSPDEAVSFCGFDGSNISAELAAHIAAFEATQVTE